MEILPIYITQTLNWKEHNVDKIQSGYYYGPLSVSYTYDT